MKWLGIDIGGANIKLANGAGFAVSYPFAMWKDHRRLAPDLRTAIAEAPECDHLAITMTGELADCFETRAEGVRHILAAVEEAADRRHTRVYLANGTLVTPQVALQKVSLAAAANWHALARFAGRHAKKGAALLIDIGSTTTDLVPLLDGAPAARATTDLERLLASEMIYTGVERSPVCGLVLRVPYRGQQCPVAQELFATTKDVYLTLGDLLEDHRNLTTADGRPSTKASAQVRLGRVICAEPDQFSATDAATLAQAVAAAQANMIGLGLRQVLNRMATPPSTFILSGHGEFVARRVLESLALPGKIVSLAELHGSAVSRSGPAHALAVLAREASGL